MIPLRSISSVNGLWVRVCGTIDNYRMAGNICGNYCAVLLPNTVQFFVCGFYLCDWTCPRPIIARANTSTFWLCFRESVFHQYWRSAYKLWLHRFKRHIYQLQLFPQQLFVMSHDNVPAFLPSLRTPPRLFSLAVRDDGLAVTLSLHGFRFSIVRVGRSRFAAQFQLILQK